MNDSTTTKDTQLATTQVNSKGFKGINSGEDLKLAKAAIAAYVKEVEDYFGTLRIKIPETIAKGFVGKYTGDMDYYVQCIMGEAKGTLKKLDDYIVKIGTVLDEYEAQDDTTSGNIKTKASSVSSNK
jgi:hypothetical protein